MQDENHEMIELVVSSALGRLTNLALINGLKLLAKENQSFRDVPEKIELIKRQLKWIECFLEDAQSKERKGDRRAKLWVQEIRDVSDQIEDLVDMIELLEEQSSRRKASVNPFKRYGAKIFVELSAIRKVGDDIHKLLSRINEISESRVRYEANLTNNYKENELSGATEDRLPAWRLIHPLFDDEANIIGLEKDTERIVTLLLDNENKKRSVISVVGMGGAGKTTLVRKVYKTKIIQESFQISAWIIVSQNYVVLDLLKNILREIIRCIEHRTTQDPTGTESRIIEQLELLDRMEEIEVRERIIHFLKMRRFLIVLDDIWSIDTWEETNTVFPNSEKGSRILLTTRNFDVAEQADRQIPPIQLQLLNDDRSWELLEKRVFLSDPDERFEREKLELIGRKLVRKCGGLPLALVVLSGLLSKKIDYHCWLNLVDVLNQESGTTMVRCTDILALSYHNLPNSYVKSCFLYTASFPADSLISTAKLIRLWVSEGLVPDNSGCTREETATCYLNKLIQASLVQVANRSEFGEHVKKIRIHDILRDWCIEEAKRIGFLNIMKGHNKSTSLCTPNTRRLVLQGNIFNKESIETLRNPRSLVGYNLTIWFVGRHRSNLFNYIRVLYLEGSTINLKGARMPNLIYLGLRNLNEPWLFSGCHFPRLDTLDIKGTSGWFRSETDVSTSLKTLYITDVPQCPNQLHLFLEKQSNLHTLTIKMESEVHNIPFQEFERFPKQLKTLKLSGGFESHNLLPSIKSLLNLTGVILQWSYLQEDPMPVLEGLPNLELLKLEEYCYNGKHMSCSTSGFPRLKYLNMEIT